MTTASPEHTTVGPPAAGVGERRQVAELANCFGTAVRAWLAFHAESETDVSAQVAAFFTEAAPTDLALSSAGGRLRRVVLLALQTWADQPDSAVAPYVDRDLAKAHFYGQWGRTLAASARQCFLEELAESPDCALLPLTDILLAGPMRAATVESLATALKCTRGAALARAQLQRARFGEIVRSLIGASVGDDDEIEPEIHELARLVELAPARPPAAAPGCRACRSVLLPDVPGLVCPACLLRAGHISALNAARSAAAEADAPAAGDRFSHYELLEEIGRGGMGVIHRARDRTNDRIVAIKLLQPGLAASPELRERFRREAKAAASLDHPNILPVFEVGERGALPFFAMQLADGGSLVECIDRLSGQPRAVAELLSPVIRAVHHAHVRGVLHRDLKPANVLLDRAGRPYVTDFGLARWIDDPGGLTRSLVVLGTAGYVAPEQAEGSGNAISPRADVYSLGVLLFELLTATRPFTGENALTVLRQAAAEPPPRARSRLSDVPRALEAICDRALQPDPAARYTSAAEMADDLDAWLAGESARSSGVPWRLRLGGWARRRPRILALGIAVALVALGLGVGSRMRQGSNDPRDSARSREATYFLKRGVVLSETSGSSEGLAQAAAFQQQAIDLDPSYATAFAELSRTHSRAYWNFIDRTPARARLAQRAAERAAELAPDLARVQLAQGEYWFRCRREDEKAMVFLRRARELAPSDVDTIGLVAMVAKRVHRWAEAIEAAQELCDIKPRDTSCLYDLAVTYEVIRRYQKAEAVFEKAFYHGPDKLHYIANRGWVRFRREGDLSGLADYVDRLKPSERLHPDNFGTVLAWHLRARKFDEAVALANALPPDFILRDSTTWWPRSFIQVMLQSPRGEDIGRLLAEAEARTRARLAERPDDARAHSTLARILAWRGETSEALAEAQRGAELVPLEREPVNGPERQVDLAEVLLRTGRTEEGIALLQRLLILPGYLTPHDLALDARWDFARSISGFDNLLPRKDLEPVR